eukprot:UN09745
MSKVPGSIPGRCVYSFIIIIITTHRFFSSQHCQELKNNQPTKSTKTQAFYYYYYCTHILLCNSRIYMVSLILTKGKSIMYYIIPSMISVLISSYYLLYEDIIIAFDLHSLPIYIFNPPLV